MKNVRMLLLLASMTVLPCMAEQPTEDVLVVKRGHEYHRIASDCANISLEELDAIKACMTKNKNDLTISQSYAALTFKIDGQDALSKAEAQSCGICPIYTERLQQSIDEFEFMVKELGAGSLTIKEFVKNDLLANKLRDFQKKRMLSKLSKKA